MKTRLLTACAILIGCTHTVHMRDGFGGSVQRHDDLPVPSSARVEVLWSVAAPVLNDIYIFGEGRSDADVFELDLSEPPPAEALNGGEFGIALLALMPNSIDLPNGRLEDLDQLGDAVIGLATQNVILYRVPGAEQSLRPWVEDFEEGYSCAKVVGAHDGTDEFEPCDCGELEITLGDLDELTAPHWR